MQQRIISLYRVVPFPVLHQATVTYTIVARSGRTVAAGCRHFVNAIREVTWAARVVPVSSQLYRPGLSLSLSLLVQLSRRRRRGLWGNLSAASTCRDCRSLQQLSTRPRQERLIPPVKKCDGQTDGRTCCCYWWPRRWWWWRHCDVTSYRDWVPTDDRPESQTEII